MNIAIGSDHRGYVVKSEVIKILESKGYEYKDFGVWSEESIDYPEVAGTVGRTVSGGEYDRGILICGTGIGICIAANKVKGIRAAACYSVFCARRARQHNDANILCLGGDVATEPLDEIVDVFLVTPFEGGRHQRRVEKISLIENG